jgi:hypothetical protein
MQVLKNDVFTSSWKQQDRMELVIQYYFCTVDPGTYPIEKIKTEGKSHQAVRRMLEKIWALDDPDLKSFFPKVILYILLL